MDSEVEEIVNTLMTGQPLEPGKAEAVARFVQSAQSKLDLGVLMIGAHHLKRYGSSSRLMDMLEKVLLPDPDMSLEEFKKHVTPEIAVKLWSTVRDDMATSFDVIRSLAKQPAASSPESMTRNLNGAEAETSAGAQSVTGISPERRQQLRNIVEILAERITVKPEPTVPLGLVKKSRLDKPLS